MGNFGDVPVDGTYPLVFLVFNTLFALTSQEEQVRCFQNVAAHLGPDGVFVIEAFVPDLTRFDRGQRVEAMRVDLDAVQLQASRHDPSTQGVRVVHMTIGADGVRMDPILLRYAWPAELDLMARLAGLRLRDRWSGWHGEPFTAASQAHVSVYERARDP